LEISIMKKILVLSVILAALIGCQKKEPAPAATAPAPAAGAPAATAPAAAPAAGAPAAAPAAPAADKK